MARSHAYAEFGLHVKQNIRRRYGDLKSFSQASGIPPKQLYEYEKMTTMCWSRCRTSGVFFSRSSG